MNKALIAFLIVFIIFITGCVKIKDCGTDLNCFKENAETCSKSKVNFVDEGTNLRVTIRGHDATSCEVSFKVEALGEDIKNKYPTETRISIGKTMNCNIDKKYSEYEQLDYTDEILNLPEKFDESCSGPIKDLMRGPLKEVIVNEFKTVLNDENIS